MLVGGQNLVKCIPIELTNFSRGHIDCRKSCRCNSKELIFVINFIIAEKEGAVQI